MLEYVQLDHEDRWNLETVLVEFEDGEDWDGLVKNSQEIQRLHLIGEQRAITDALAHKQVRYAGYVLLLGRMIDASKHKSNIELLKWVLKWVERGGRYAPKKSARIVARRILLNNYLNQQQLF